MTREERALLKFEEQLNRIRNMDDLYRGVKLDETQKKYRADHRLEILKDIKAISITEEPEDVPPLFPKKAKQPTPPPARVRSKQAARAYTMLDITDDHFTNDYRVVDQLLQSYAD